MNERDLPRPRAAARTTKRKLPPGLAKAHAARQQERERSELLVSIDARLRELRAADTRVAQAPETLQLLHREARAVLATKDGAG